MPAGGYQERGLRYIMRVTDSSELCYPQIGTALPSLRNLHYTVMNNNHFVWSENGHRYKSADPGDRGFSQLMQSWCFDWIDRSYRRF